VSDRYAYDPYGNVTASSGSVANPWQFAGGYYDASTGLTKFGDRYYESNSGRWTQADTLAGNITDPQSLNRFVYAADDPVNLIDPSGADAWGAIVNFVEHKAISCFGDVVVGIGGGLVTVVGTVVGATVIGFWPGIGLIVLGTAGIAYGAAGVANGGC
jgi:RHS repeat-associated protein